MPRLNLIYARAANGVIGKDNALPWHLPEDLAHFKRHTLGAPVLMGRKTWDSLPPRFRPLPGRQNTVLTRDAQWRAEGAQRAGSLPEALALCGDAPEIWVIGGAELYREALPHAQRAVVTEIAQAFEGDAFMPALGPEWTETAREAHTAANGLPFAFVTYVRKP
ncbi:MAG: dihydrofolate reductase [Hydrogenophaga sp.]|uniref:Dihydrofolate reductase n=1 Tax=Hydrogenophaga crocea TaxID=2716225 RepID=A0A6G8IDZ2_9BURK|nr:MULTISPECIES: dihydrofolate reductase [Hydrogenophaga]MBL0943524.1 dihydrofolate reductase [Hydrogenophaga sp.]QIM51353.1 dihydrofolate reductase [Hydrogenophaga crocea]